MRKIISIMVIAILAVGTICAQDKVNPRENSRQREINTVSIEGTLKLEKGLVSVQSGDSVYLIPLLNRYIGFINGLREGTKVSVEGKSFRNVIMPKKVVIDDKTYDFIAGGPRNNLEPRNQNHGRRDLGPAKNFAPGRNMFPPRNMAPGRNMVPPGRNMGPGHQNFNPGQKNAPNPHPRVRPGVSESS
jgi:hypothetical protein